ncbi:MAG: hypothetical protein PHS32_00095 [Rhodoferax sp.]|uniref:hypothetical protein n=1 Tax=Rhodoferax sp. TaxID=50421 RepID=UPI00261DFD83|nr:hypothetical protein [Rhodoferax sp.]MDD5332116.1 hypothetical protein [Rhodoferax sp.]
MGDSEQQKANQRYLNWLATPLAVKSRDTLKLACSALKLSDDIFSQVEFQTRLLRDFHTHGKQKLKSPREQVKSLEDVETAAKALHKAIQNLDQVQCVGIWYMLPSDELSTSRVIQISTEKASATVGTVVPDSHVVYPTLRGRVGHIGAEAERLSKIAHSLCQAEGGKSKAGGKKNVQSYYAWHVGKIYEAVKGTTINLGRNGNFSRLCTAVYDAAGVNIDPDGAIRKLVSDRKLAEQISDDAPF